MSDEPTKDIAKPEGSTSLSASAEDRAVERAADRIFREFSFHTEDDRERAIQSLIAAVNNSSETARNAWLFFLAMMAYFYVAIAGVKDEALLLNSPVTLPVVNIAITLEAFFIFAPPVVMLVHFGLLLQHFLLADKAVKLHSILESDSNAYTGGSQGSAGDKRADDVTDVHRHTLHSYFFTQSVAGRRFGFFATFLFYVLGFVSFVFLPIMLLLSFQTKFLPYHAETITSSHRIYLLIDILLVIFMLAKARAPRASGWRGFWTRATSDLVPFVVRTSFLVLALGYSMLVATVPEGAVEKWADATVGKALPLAHAREYLFDGKVDPVRGTTSSPFNRRIVVTDNLGLKQNGVLAGDNTQKDTRQINLRGRDLRGAVLDRTDLSNADLTNVDLSKASLKGTVLKRARLGGAKLVGAQLVDADMSGADFGCVETVRKITKDGRTESIPVLQCAKLVGADLSNAKLEGANLKYANLQRTTLQYAKMQNAELSGINLREAKMSFATLSGSNMREADISGAVLIRAKLDGVNLEFADMQHSNFLQADLRGAKLTLARAPGASFRLAKMHGADLQLAWLHLADLTGAALTAADLRGAQLIGADIRLADLTAADLASTKLQGANMKNTSTQAANFTHAKIWETVPPSQNVKRRTVLGDIRFLKLPERDQRVLAGIAYGIGIDVGKFGIEAIGAQGLSDGSRVKSANDTGHDQRVRERLVRMLPELAGLGANGTAAEWNNGFDHKIWRRLKSQSVAEYASVTKAARGVDSVIFENLICGDKTPEARRSQVILRRVLRANACPGRRALLRGVMLSKPQGAERRFAHLFLQTGMFSKPKKEMEAFGRQCPSFRTLQKNDAELISRVRGLMVVISKWPERCITEHAIDPPKRN